jgi:signal transduction histidine kinase
VPAIVLLFGSVRLLDSDFSPAQQWVVAGWTVASTTVAVVAEALTFLVRLVEGRPVSEPQFPLMVLAGVGAVGGLVIGWLYVDAQRETEDARRASEAMAFVNRLLRHDIRNGVQVIRTHADLVAEADDERISESGRSIREQADAVQQLIGDVGSISAVLREEADRETIDLAVRLEEAIETARESYPDATFETRLPDTCAVEGTDALVPVFTNLLNNAVQHNDADQPHVRLVADTDDETVAVVVEDNGSGIADDDRERVFEAGVTSNDEGGFGLYIVRTLLDRSGGSIRVADSDLGGAAFVVELPAAEASDLPGGEDDRPAGW